MKAKEPKAFAVVEPMDQAVEHGVPYYKVVAADMAITDGYSEEEMQEVADRINAAHAQEVSARLSAQREAHCKAVCDVCAQDVPIIKNHHCFSFAHDFGDMVVPSVRYLNCRAAAIRALPMIAGEANTSPSAAGEAIMGISSPANTRKAGEGREG